VTGDPHEALPAVRGVAPSRPPPPDRPARATAPIQDVPNPVSDVPKFNFDVPKFVFDASYVNFWIGHTDTGSDESTFPAAPGRIGAPIAG